MVKVFYRVGTFRVHPEGTIGLSPGFQPRDKSISRTRPHQALRVRARTLKWLRFCEQMFKSIFVPRVRILSRRDYRTQPGVLTPGTDKEGTHPEGGGREAFSVLECRTRSSTNFCRPFGTGPYCQCVLGLKPQAQFYSPFLLRHPELRRTGRDKEFHTI